MAAVAATMIVAGAYLMYVAYEAIHHKLAAAPITKASTAIS